MADGLPRFCIFGDSHYACLKQAEVQGLVDVSGASVEDKQASIEAYLKAAMARQ